jgi:hypothetical protein
MFWIVETSVGTGQGAYRVKVAKSQLPGKKIGDQVQVEMTGSHMGGMIQMTGGARMSVPGVIVGESMF